MTPEYEAILRADDWQLHPEDVALIWAALDDERALNGRLREALEQVQTWTSGFASDFEGRICATATVALAFTPESAGAEHRALLAVEQADRELDEAQQVWDASNGFSDMKWDRVCKAKEARSDALAHLDAVRRGEGK